MTDGGSGGTATLIFGIAAVLTAILGPAGIKSLIGRRKTRQASETSPAEREAIQALSSDPTSFVKLILGRLEAAEKKVEAMDRKLRDRDKHDRLRNVALARWMRRILEDWGIAEHMPMPEEEDREILADVIPAALEATRPRPPRLKEDLA